MPARPRAPLAAVGAAAACIAAAAVAAPPSLIIFGGPVTDLSADGMTLVGVPFDQSLGENIVYTYTRGVGATRSGLISEYDVRCSGDAGVVTFINYDVDNIAGLGTTKLTSHL